MYALNASQAMISRKEMRESLLRSGYLLESRLETVLRKNGYYVETNAAFPDAESGKSRELDAYAMSAVSAGREERDFVFAVLLIECINNPQPVAFITKDPQVAFLHYEEVKLAGIPVKIPIEGQRDSWESLPYFLGMDKYHHYCRGRIATQYCSFAQKKNLQEWMASHDDAHFDAFKKVCAAAEHYISAHFKSWVFNGRENINVEFYYPIVIFQGQLIDVRLGRETLALTRADHVQFRRSAFVGEQEVDYQIDVVTERFFPKFLKIVENEQTKTARLMKQRQKKVRKAISTIVRRAKRLRSPEKIRETMEF